MTKEFTEKEIVQEVIDELQHLIDCAEPSYCGEGLCDKVANIIEPLATCSAHQGRFLCFIFKEWECFSGNMAYPIAHKNLTPYGVFHGHTNQWDYNEYGMKRRDLTETVIDYLEEIKETYQAQRKDTAKKVTNGGKL